MVYNTITIPRGDTWIDSITITQNRGLCSSRYTLSENDKVYLGVYEPNHLFEESLIKKVYDSNSATTDDGDLIIHIKPEDTYNLLPGTYYLCVKLRCMEEGSPDIVTTIIPPTILYIV